MWKRYRKRSILSVNYAMYKCNKYGVQYSLCAGPFQYLLDMHVPKVVEESIKCA